MAHKITLEHKDDLMDAANIKIGKRDGTIIEKGIVLQEEYLVKNERNLQGLFQFFMAYPDRFLDLITPEEDSFRLFFYQRIVLRALMRFKEVYITAPRAFSKSFLTILALMLQCVFIPRHKDFICAPHAIQSARIAREKILEIYDHWPLLKREIFGWELKDDPGNFGKDSVTLKFRNGSQFDVVGTTDSTRGGRRNSGLVDEVRDHEEGPVNEIVLPLIAVSRRLPDNTVNPKEPNAQTLFMTSAGMKGSFGYDILIDVFERSIIFPETSFTFGCDYRVPMIHGLLDKDFINKLKMSPSYNEESFAAEYGSIWRGGSQDSWFSYDRLQKYRKIKNPEWHAISRPDKNFFYLFSVDVGRIHDQTAVTIFRVNVGENKFYSTLVNLVVLGRTPQTKPFAVQARDLKRLIKLYNPDCVVIDGNGLGIGLCDEMIKTQLDDETGEILPAYGFLNSDDYKKVQPREARQILYIIKATQELKSQINSNAYSTLFGGKVRFLIKEQEAKSALLSTKVGQKMTHEQRIRRLLPHEMTTRLFEEMANLRIKKAGVSIILEPINSHFPDDKYYSFVYGLWRIKEIEEEHFKRKRRKNRFGEKGSGGRRFVFYTGG